MSEAKASGYISQLTFNNGKTLDIQKNDILIFVGPNNAGKSQSLKDIYALAKDKAPTIVVSDIKTEKQQGSVLAVLEDIASSIEVNNIKVFSLHNGDIGYGPIQEKLFPTQTYFGDIRLALIANLDTSAPT